MQFSDTSTKNGLIQDCEFLTGLGDATITGDSALFAIFTRSINQWYQKVVTMILDSQDSWDFDDINFTDYGVATANLVASQRDYTLPASLNLLKIKRVDVTYDGTNWYKAEPFDINETGLGVGNDTAFDANFDSSKPFYDMKANAIWLYPRPSSSVTNGMRVEFMRSIDEFTVSDTTQKPSIDAGFHRMLSAGASFDWAVAKGLSNANTLSALLTDYENRLRTYYGRKNVDEQVVLKAGYVDYH